MATYDYSAYPPPSAAPAPDPYQSTYGHHPPPHSAYPPPAAYPPPHQYSYPPPGGAPYGANEEIRTLFITGFPNDVKERELNNMLRFLPGYEASQMNWKNGQAQGFALFSNGPYCRSAVDALTGLCFDQGAVLRTELARKNMYIKEDPTMKRARPNPPPYGSYPPPREDYGRPQGYAPVTNTGDNSPCNTLFVGNLGDNVSEQELTNLFRSSPGFRQLKLVRGSKNISCFVEYEDVATAMAVHAQHQGAILTSSDRGGIRIQYSKNPFGKKRDVTGNFIDTAARDSATVSGAPVAAGAPGTDVYGQPAPGGPAPGL